MKIFLWRRGSGFPWDWRLEPHKPQGIGGMS
jgi:hypothetical protein